MTLETIIRPFQTRIVTPPRLAPTAAPGDVGDPVKLEFGKGTGVKSINGGVNLTVTYYSIKRPTEKTTPTSETTTNKELPQDPPPGGWQYEYVYPEYYPPEYELAGQPMPVEKWQDK